MSNPQAPRQTGIVNRSAPKATVVPVLVYEDVAKAIGWLCEAFGFAERLRAARPDGRAVHAQLSIGEGAVMLGAAGGDFKPPGPREVSQYVIVRVADLDAHFEHAKRFGARIVQPPADMPFGERVYTAEDLAGYRWTFSQSIADVPLEQWGATPARSKQ
ncbi:MAG TPA: VOC family protein [Verrucomicrobiae bacterium]|jgi:uncharacterized glyoxalase superfamily protein PhnB|nr:VOC family protein [Verrucomicrobiae bacterium]